MKFLKIKIKIILRLESNFNKTSRTWKKQRNMVRNIMPIQKAQMRINIGFKPMDFGQIL